MKIYLVDNENDAKQIGQLMKLNAECAKLHWSKTIKNLPAEVLSSLETLENYIEEKVYEVCTKETLVGSLSEDEESSVMSLMRKIPELRATLGVGLIMAGAEANSVSALMEGKTVPKALLSAIASGKNVILF